MLPDEIVKLGLSSDEVKQRLAKYGKNILPEKPPPSSLNIFFSQLKNPLVYILVLAGLVTLALSHYADTIIILISVLINTTLGFIQEKRASNALFALKQLVNPSALVIRDGKQIKVSVIDVVPGDMCVISQGDKVPADGELVFINRLFVNEAILTGESEIVRKGKGDEIYMGTVIAGGRGVVKVRITGKETQIGQIALAVQETKDSTPLQRQLTLFSKRLTYIVLALVVGVLVIGVIRQNEPGEIFGISVALAVSAVPEGLLVGLTVVLAIGMQRILKRKGLVRNLTSAETLGGVTAICVDKTGTLTEGKMRVIDHEGDGRKLAIQAYLANDMDDPIVIAARHWAESMIKNSGLMINKLEKKYPRLDSLPFSGKDRVFVSLNKWNTNTNMLFVNGAPEYVVKWSGLDDGQQSEVKNSIDKFTSSGKRVLGLARKSVPSDVKQVEISDARNGLEWIGLLVFSDPVRSGVKSALEKTDQAGVDLFVVTGDYAETAINVMTQLGLHACRECVMAGSQLTKLSSKELSEKLTGDHPVSLFARTSPDQKLVIVEALKRNGEIVAMMGDGVNDAPALSRADIGIVVSEASDVAKETADLVLTDSRFSTIEAAIEEGRGINDNIRKIILYLLSDSFEEIVAVVGAILIGLPLPVTAAQILWINLVSDGFPDLALTIDPKEKNIMSRGPRDVDGGLITKWMRYLIAIVSLSGGFIALMLFIWVYFGTKDLVTAQSVAFAALGVNSLVYVFSIRTLKKPFWKENPFKNKWLNVAVIAGFILQFLPFALPGFRKLFGVVSLNLTQWLMVFIASLVMFIIIESCKVLLPKEEE